MTESKSNRMVFREGSKVCLTRGEDLNHIMQFQRNARRWWTRFSA